MDIMELLPLLLTVGGIFLVSGILVGYILAGLFKGKESDLKPRQVKANEVLCVLRDPSSSRLQLEIDKKAYSLVDDMTVAQHTRLVKLLEELRVWSGAPAAPVMMPAAVGPDTQAAAVKPSGSSPLLARIQGKPGEKPEGEDAKDKVKPVSTNLIDIVARAVTADIPKDPSKPKSIAAQVDEILQEKLENSPLKARAIRLMELPDKGLVVMVGMEQFEGVADVPYPEVRELLRECVREWEKRAG